MNIIKYIYRMICGMVLFTLCPMGAMDDQENNEYVASGLEDTSQAQREQLKTYILSQKRKLGKNTPVLILEEIVEQMGNKFAPLTQEIFAWLSGHIEDSPVFDETVTSYTMSPDGRYMFVKFNGKLGRVYDITNGVQQMGGDLTFNVVSLRFSPNSRYILIYGDNRYELYDLSNGMQPVGDVIIDGVSSADFSLDSKYIKMHTYNNNRHHIYSIRDGFKPMKLDFLKDASIVSVDISSNGRYLFVEKKDNNERRESFIYSLKGEGTVDLIAKYDVNNILVRKNREYIVTTYNDGEICRIYDVNNHMQQIGHDVHTVLRIDFSPDNRHVMIMSKDNDNNKMVGVYDMHNNLALVGRINIDGFIGSEFSPDGRYLNALYVQNKIRFYDVEHDMEPIGNLVDGKYVFYGPNGRHVCIISKGVCSLYDMHNDLQQVGMDVEKVGTVLFSPNGQYIVYINIPMFGKEKLQVFNIIGNKLIPIGNAFGTSDDVYAVSPVFSHGSNYLYYLDHNILYRKSLKPLNEILHQVSQDGLNLIATIYKAINKEKGQLQKELTNDEKAIYQLLPVTVQLLLDKYVITKSSEPIVDQ